MTTATAPATTKRNPASAPAIGSADRRWPVGAEPTANGQTNFRVWAPQRKNIAVVVDGKLHELTAEGNGYFSALLSLGVGTKYHFRLDGAEKLLADPVSRFQPDGPFGPSEVIDPNFQWTDAGWAGSPPEGRVLYEMHVGTFTPEGTWAAAALQLERLAKVGVNLVEAMPVADFPGNFGWGYDGVNLFAPTRLYGRPDDFRTFVDRAHALGIGVILDVVYNHVGPAGNVMTDFSPSYFTDRYKTDWGLPINFDGPDAEPVREFYLMNAAYWIAEYHLDGLRIDATQNIYDESDGEHILAGIARVTRAAAGKRPIVLVSENEPQETRLVRPADNGGHGHDMLWNDDFHHSARVALTGRSEAYYSDYRGRPQELISAIKHGYLYQGQHYHWQKKGRGTPGFDLPPWAFVTFLDNHDQIANSGAGQRTRELTNPGSYRAMTALMLLAPATPMLFQGQEFGASTPFFYFADHAPELAVMVRDGRLDFLKQFPSLSDPSRPPIPDPHLPDTFARSKLNLAEANTNTAAVALHGDLLRLRREDATFSQQRMHRVDGAVLSGEAFVLRFFGDTRELDRLLLINLGADLEYAPMPEPLLAPPLDRDWSVHWSSEDAPYGGGGRGAAQIDTSWILPGHSALVLFPEAEKKTNNVAESVRCD